MLPLTARKSHQSHRELLDEDYSKEHKDHSRSGITQQRVVIVVAILLTLYVFYSFTAESSTRHSRRDVIPDKYPFEGIARTGCPLTECKPNRRNPFSANVMNFVVPCTKPELTSSQQGECTCPCAGVAWHQGPREHQEDRFAFDPPLYGVFDGHGGAFASSYLREHFFTNYRKIFLDSPPLPPGSVRGEREAASLRSAFQHTDAMLEEHLKTDGGIHHDGSTAVVAVFLPDMMSVMVGWIGDSRSVIGYLELKQDEEFSKVATIAKRWQATRLSNDHKPVGKERERIESLGGQVLQRDIPRVEGILAMSRAVGDFALRPYVIPEPEFTLTSIMPGHRLIIIASDGVWDVISDHQAVVMAGTMLADGRTLEDIAAYIVQEAGNRGSHDNITAMVIDVNGLHDRCG